MDKFEFMNGIKELLEKIDNEILLNNKGEIKKIMFQMVEMEYEYIKSGIR